MRACENLPAFTTFFKILIQDSILIKSWNDFRDGFVLMPIARINVIWNAA